MTELAYTYGAPAMLEREGVTLRHVQPNESLIMHDLIDQNRQFLSQTMEWVASYTPEEALTQRALAHQLASEGKLFDYWIEENDEKVGAIEMMIGSNRNALLGYWLVQSAQGRGIATKAARCLLDYGFMREKLQTVLLFIRPHNQASARVAQRLGAELVGETIKQDINEVFFNVWEVARA